MSNIDSSVLIVIPAFNEELVLDKTLDALLNEVSANQVLVVSDGSTDKTAEIVKAKNINLLEDRKSTRLNSSHMSESRMPSSA